MDLMTLAAKITLDDSGFQKGVNQAESTGQKLAGKMSAMTVAVGNIAADMIRKGASAVKQIVGGAMEGYADYQQLIGGVETLFKNSANKVAGYAQESYRTTGLSMNQYMETVTSFSASLLQGLQGNTEKAADMANMAITDMADNANKMGTDISAIQNAYQGFAKQNFTMLDNLKLGYGGTREEMVRLINDSGILDKQIKDLDGITFDQIVDAIHVIQTQMGITGTTAKEASETISGSKNSLKAAWEDLLTVVGGAGDQARMDQAMENFKTSFSTYMENFIPSLIHTISGSGSLVTAIAESIAELPTTLLSEIGEAGLGSATEMVGGVSKITSWLISSITNMFKSASANPGEIAEFGKAIGDFLGTAIQDIVVNAPAILQGIIDIGVNLAGGLVEGLFQGLFGQDAEVDKIVDQLDETISDAEFKATKSGALLSYLDSLYKEYGNAVTQTEAWKQAIEDLKGVMPESEKIFSDFAGDVGGALSALQQMNEELRKTAINSALIKALQDEYTLLAQQTVEYNKEKNRYERNQFIAEDTEAKLRRQITESARKTAAEYWANTHDENDNVTGVFDETRYADLMRLASGLARVGDELMNLDEVDFDGLSSIVSFLLDEELEKNLKDEYKTIQDAQEQMRQAKEGMDQWQQEIDATKQGIEDTKAGVVEASKELNSSLGNTANGVNMGGSAVAAALAGAAAQIASISFSSGGGGGGSSGNGGALGVFGTIANAASNMITKVSSMFTGHATGMDYVPYNGYRAELHRGEAVLTKRQADAYRNGGRAAVDIYEAVDRAVESAMSNVFVMMSGEKVGDLTTKRISKNINASSYNKIRAMGG